MMIYILYMAHFLADFTFQTTKLAQGKRNHMKDLICHAVIYAAVFLAVMFSMIKSEKAVLPFIIIVFSHFFIDWAGMFAENRWHRKSFVFASFIVDQLLHGVILAAVYFAFHLAEETTALYGLMRQIPCFHRLVVCCLIGILLWDPAAVFIKKLFQYLFDEGSGSQKGNDSQEESDLQTESDPQAGRIIGKLERIIIAVLILCNQFGAIGFVLTAKSIARYKQLEDKNFAEKYLVGTLTSVLIAFITTMALGILN